MTSLALRILGLGRGPRGNGQDARSSLSARTSLSSIERASVQSDDWSRCSGQSGKTNTGRCRPRSTRKQ